MVVDRSVSCRQSVARGAFDETLARALLYRRLTRQVSRCRCRRSRLQTRDLRQEARGRRQ